MSSHQPNKLIKMLDLREADKSYEVCLCLCSACSMQHYEQMSEALHPEEKQYYKGMKYFKRKTSYLIGRYAAKYAVTALTNQKYINNIVIRKGVFNQPIVITTGSSNIQVSLTHCQHIGGALAFREHTPMGIDLEKIDPARRNVIESLITEAEKQLIKEFPYSYDASLMIMWTAKEAVSKALKTGLTVPLKIYEISSITVENKYLRIYYKNFLQYCSVSFELQGYICSVTYPKNLDLILNIEKLIGEFNSSLGQAVFNAEEKDNFKHEIIEYYK